MAGVGAFKSFVQIKKTKYGQPPVATAIVSGANHIELFKHLLG